jgi:hypothetical protein
MFSLSLPVQTTPIARPSLSMIGEPDIPPTVLAPVIHSGPPKLCTRQACHRRSSDKRNAQSRSGASGLAQVLYPDRDGRRAGPRRYSRAGRVTTSGFVTALYSFDRSGRLALSPACGRACVRPVIHIHTFGTGTFTLLVPLSPILILMF